ncbi:TonB-dependent receptor [Lutibacter sp. B1]|uniref:SusC/RagA family TonB-linked outer membrane protein n=1 Tax=Lutibacter sp. B1 TaxID=2725996 RepID=UPI001456C347|nr:TonB-dependent receptor [Lutibacter sp. B1]NLP58948.1 TonB-dependent receptor [Lutibacter sp. B1]
MKTKLICSLLLFPLLFFAQERNITGKVTSFDGMPIPSVSVLIKNTTRGVVTDFDGVYSISARENEILVFSYIGLKTKEVVIGTSNIIDVTLEEDTSTLEEVVVIGYGVVQKKDLTGSITSIKSDEILKQPALTPAQSLQGKASGLQIISSGAPGSSPVVRIRGTGTILAGRDPIYVVDGIITDRIDNINSDDIVSMDILKDASSLAIYGSRGANGVIMVTTKSGKQGKMKIDVSSYYGIKTMLSEVNMANSESYVSYSNLAFGYNRFSTDQQYNTDWFDEITRTGSVMNHNITVSGGSEKISALFSANYFEEEGILKGNDYRRLNLRNKVKYDISPKLKFEHNISLSINRSIPKPYSAFTTAYKQSPLVPVKYEDGVFEGRWGVPFDDSGARYNNVGNPVSQLELSNEKHKNTIIQGNVSVEYEILDDLKFNTSFGIESGFGKYYIFNDNLAAYLAGDPNREVEDFESSNLNTLTVRKSDYYHWIYDAFLTYTKTLADDHHFKLVVGTTTEKEQSDFLKGVRNNVPNNTNLFSLNNGEAGTDIATSGLSNLKTLRSYFGRLSYDYLHKYLLTATIRRDGSSVFANKNKNWGNFPSVGLGWVISEENFLKDVEFINQLKIRGSWGKLGNQNIPLNELTFNSDLGYVLGSDQSYVPGSTVTAIVDENVSWEVTEEFDLGLEFSLLDYRLSGEVDYYNRLNKNAILPISLPKAFGASGTTLTHAGKVRNKGFEFALNWKDKIGDDFTYNIGGNLTYNENELEKITNQFAFEQSGGSIDNGQVTKLLREGEPIGSFYLLEVLGFDERGEFVYNDINDDGVIDNDDRKFFGSYQPDVFYGINIGCTYKNWDFSVDGYGNAGNKIYNGKKAQRFGGENIEQTVANNMYSATSASNQNPAPFNDVPPSSTYFLEDGDFFRINNITVGYTFSNVIEGIQKIRIYGLAQNPFIFKSFSGYTPELPGNGDPLGTSGIELYAYPSVTSYLFGVNINF